jgi:hypothetical protein
MLIKKNRFTQLGNQLYLTMRSIDLGGNHELPSTWSVLSLRIHVVIPLLIYYLYGFAAYNKLPFASSAWSQRINVMIPACSSANLE